MIRIPKEETDRLVLAILSEMSKDNGKEFSEQSFKLMNDEHDNSIFTGIILGKSKPTILSNKEEHLYQSMYAIIETFFETADEFDVDLKEDGYSPLLVKSFNQFRSDSNLFEENSKMRFALVNFVMAFLEYDKLEKKYPEIMKFM